jgi:hypothetical protein
MEGEVCIGFRHGATPEEKMQCTIDTNVLAYFRKSENMRAAGAVPGLPHRDIAARVAELRASLWNPFVGGWLQCCYPGGC